MSFMSNDVIATMQPCNLVGDVLLWLIVALDPMIRNQAPFQRLRTPLELLHPT